MGFKHTDPSAIFTIFRPAAADHFFNFVASLIFVDKAPMIQDFIILVACKRQFIRYLTHTKAKPKCKTTVDDEDFICGTPNMRQKRRLI